MIDDLNSTRMSDSESSEFCCPENFTERLAYLDHELGLIGYPSFINEPNNNESKPSSIDQIAFTNIAYHLLQGWKDLVQKYRNEKETNRISESEIRRLNSLVETVKNEVTAREQEVASKTILCKKTNKRISQLEKQLRALEEKNKKLSSDMVSKETQYRHEKNKKIQEFEKLKTHLHQLLQEKRGEKILGIDILNSLQRIDGSRGKWASEKAKYANEKEVHRLTISHYEDIKLKLTKENEEMRNCLRNMHTELMIALRDISSSDLDYEEEDGLEEGIFNMPFDSVKEDIEKNLKQKWNKLKEETTRLSMHQLGNRKGKNEISKIISLSTFSNISFPENCGKENVLNKNNVNTNINNSNNTSNTSINLRDQEQKSANNGEFGNLHPSGLSGKVDKKLKRNEWTKGRNKLLESKTSNESFHSAESHSLKKDFTMKYSCSSSQEYLSANELDEGPKWESPTEQTSQVFCDIASIQMSNVLPDTSFNMSKYRSLLHQFKISRDKRLVDVDSGQSSHTNIMQDYDHNQYILPPNINVNKSISYPTRIKQFDTRDFPLEHRNSPLKAHSVDSSLNKSSSMRNSRETIWTQQKSYDLNSKFNVSNLQQTSTDQRKYEK